MNLYWHGYLFFENLQLYSFIIYGSVLRKKLFKNNLFWKSLLWADVCHSLTHMLKSLSSVLQNVTIYEDRAFKDITALKWVYYGGPNPLSPYKKRILEHRGTPDTWT